MQQVFDIDALESRPRHRPASLRQSKAWTYLKESDRTILEMTEKGIPLRLIGQAIGLNAGTVSRRIALIKMRLQTNLARCALDPATPLPAEHREMALLHAVTGLSLREIARARRVPLNAVTEHIRYAQGVARAVFARRSSA